MLPAAPGPIVELDVERGTAAGVLSPEGKPCEGRGSCAATASAAGISF
jgi:hypothetical protein